MLRQPLEDLVRSPVMTALVGVVWVLKEHRGNGLIERGSGAWYGNPPRLVS
jgi:hypothetical protein